MFWVKDNSSEYFQQQQEIFSIDRKDADIECGGAFVSLS